MKTIVINLFGGSGCGKSTTSCGIFYFMKMAGYDIELVREYVKQWAWEGRRVGPYDQPVLYGRQLQLEKCLYGTLPFIVTDSPILLSPMYEEFYQGESMVKPGAFKFLDQVAKEGVVHLNFLLKRTKPFKQAGRYENAETAQKMDQFVKDKMAEWGKSLVEINVDDEEKPAAIIKYVEEYIKNNPFEKSTVD